jgi:hypothetical protein
MNRSLFVPLTAVALTFVLAAPAVGATESRSFERSRSADISWERCRRDTPRTGLRTCTSGEFHLWKGTRRSTKTENGTLVRHDGFKGHETCFRLTRHVTRLADGGTVRIDIWDGCPDGRPVQDARRLDVGFEGLRRAWAHGTPRVLVIRLGPCYQDSECVEQRTRERVGIQLDWTKAGPRNETFRYERASTGDCETTKTSISRSRERTTISGRIGRERVEGAVKSSMSSLDRVSVKVCA